MSLQVQSLYAASGQFKNVNFSLRAGEVLAIIGPNGAGKTSLLKALAGDCVCEQGAVLYEGCSVHSWSLSERARQLASLPQLSLLNFPYTVEEVVQLGRIPHATGKLADKKIVEATMRQLDILSLRSRLYTELSGGERQRVQLARVLAQISLPADRGHERMCRYLLLDEPTASLDLGHRQQLMQLVRDYARQGVTVLVAVHDISLAARYADRVLAMKSGAVMAWGTVEEVVTEPLIRNLYEAEISVIKHPQTGKPVVLGG